MAYKALYECDLHTHSTRSDGNDSYSELIANAAGAGVRVLAITDHDIKPADTVIHASREIPLHDFGLTCGVVVIPGIEFSCDTEVDDVHIVGLGCDFSHTLFLEEERLSVESKIDGYRALLSELGKRSMPISWDEILGETNPPRKDEDVQRKHIFEMIAKKGYADSWSEAKLRVKNDPSLNIRRRKPDPLHIIELLHKTGGIAILAHPYLIDEPVQSNVRSITRQEYIKRLIKSGLDGIECSYPYEKTSYNGARSSIDIERDVRTEYQSCGLILSGGSDYHNDALKGAKNPRLLGEKGVCLEYFQSNEKLMRLLTPSQMKLILGT